MADVVYILEVLRSREPRHYYEKIIEKFDGWYWGRVPAQKLGVTELVDLLQILDPKSSAFEKLSMRLETLKRNYRIQRNKRHIRAAMRELLSKDLPPYCKCEETSGDNWE